MPLDPRRSRTHARFVALAIALVAAPAEAQTGLCPPVCPGTGNSAYASVQFFAAAGGNHYKLDAPFLLDRAFGDANGSARGIVDLATGTLRAGAASYGLSGAGLITQGVDEFTVAGPHPVGAPVSVTVNFVASGSGLIQSPFASMLAMIQVGFPGGANDFDLQVYQAPGNVPLNTLFPILLTASHTFVATVGTPFDLGYFLRLESGNGAGSHLDFLNSAHLSFALPAGATISSVGGFSSAAVAVPEPSTFVLVAGGLVALAAARRRARSRRLARSIILAATTPSFHEVIAWPTKSTSASSATTCKRSS